GALNAVNALYFGNSQSGRLFGFQSRFADPNELTLLLLMCCCFHIWRISDPDRSLPGRVLSIGVVVVSGVAAAQTGSRGGAAALCIVLAYVLYRSSWWTRIKVVAGVAVAAL